MSPRWHNAVWILPLSLGAALLLGMIPLPTSWQPLRPWWLALVLAWWVIEMPQRAGLGLAFCIGLLADLTYGSLLGEHALRLVVFTLVLQHLRTRFRFFPEVQQVLVIGGLLLADQWLSSFLHILLKQPVLPWKYWCSALPGMVLWLPVCTLLDSARRYWR